LYIIFSFIFFSVFFLNLNIFISLFFLIFFLVYFFYTINVFSFYEAYTFLEDRLVILLENITKVDYNLIVLGILIIFFIFFFNVELNLNLIFFFLFLIGIQFTIYQDFYTYLFYTTKLNNKLLNGLFLIHPLLIYTFYSFFFVFSVLFFYWTYFCSFGKTNHDGWKLFLFNKLFNRVFLSFGLSALILGGWWAFQEINWNGWWSWDLIEIINLLLLLYSLNFLHISRLGFMKEFFYNLSFYNFFCIPLFFLIITRFNLVNSLHSFVLLENFSQILFVVQFGLIILLFLLFYWKFVCRTSVIYLQWCSLLKYFFSVSFSIFFFKILYELGCFFLNWQSYIEYFYFFKHYLVYLFYFVLFCTLKFSYWFLFSFFSLTYFFEILFCILLISQFLAFRFNFFKWHFFVYSFFLYLSCLSFSVDFSFKNWVFNYFYFFENFKISYFFFKDHIYYGFSTVYLPMIFNVDYYSALKMTDAYLTYSQDIVYFLSNFYLIQNFFLIHTYKFFFYYSYVFTKYSTLFWVFFYVYYYCSLLLKKKLELYY